MKLILLISFLIGANAFNSRSVSRRRIEVETKLVEILEGYVKSAETNLSRLKKLVKDFAEEHSRIGSTEDAYIENPVNNFLLIKRLTKQLKEIESLISDAPKEFQETLSMAKIMKEFPNERDFQSALNAIAQIRGVYNFPTSELSTGVFTGQKQPLKYQLNTELCLEMAKYFYEYDHQEAQFWINEASRKCSQDSKCSLELKETILEYEAFIAYFLGQLDKAILVTELLLEINPKHPRAKGNLNFFQYEMNYTPLELRKGQVIMEPNGKISDNLLYSLTCRGIVKPIDEKLPWYRPSCEVFTPDDPYYKLSPIKAEDLYNRPYIVVFKNFITNTEIEMIKELFENDVTKIFDEHNKDTRKKNEVTLDDNRKKFLYTLSHKLSTVSRYGGSTPLTVVNFELGGETKPHYDFLRGTPLEDQLVNKQDYRATVLLYLSDVKKGGATVFPRLQLSIPVEKGSVILWMNYAGGKPDPLTLHGECPVIVGDKWVANKRFTPDDH